MTLLVKTVVPSLITTAITLGTLVLTKTIKITIKSKTNDFVKEHENEIKSIASSIKEHLNSEQQNTSNNVFYSIYSFLSLYCTVSTISSLVIILVFHMLL